MNSKSVKKIFASFALMLVTASVSLPSIAAIGFGFAPNVAHAQQGGTLNVTPDANQGLNYTNNIGIDSTPPPQTQQPDVVITTDPNQSSGTPDLNTVNAFTDNAQNNPNAVTPPPSTNPPATSDLSCGVNVLCALVQFTASIFTFMSNLVATVAGLVADFSIWYSIQSNTYGLLNPFLETGWKLILGFTNLVFLFTLFVVAFSLIFGTNILNIDPKRAFGYVILMALIVNFSFFLTRSVIEVGNTAATVLYTKIASSSTDTNQVDNGASNIDAQNSKTTQLGAPSTFFQNSEFAGMKSISLGILNKVNPQELILNTSKIASSDVLGGLGKSYDWSFYVLYLFLAFATLIFNMLLIYIFASIAILFFGRIVGLALAIIFSPIAFVSVVIPSLKEKEYLGFDDWIKQVVGLTFVAPIYMIFLYLTILFLNVNLFGGKIEGYLLIATVIFIKLLLVSLILLRGKSLAFSMSGHIGEMVGGIAGTVTGLALGAATGGTAMLARGTIGRAGAAVATNGSLQRIASGGPNEKIQAAQTRLASGIRNFGVGKYRLGNTSTGRSISGAVENSGLANIGASSAQGLRTFGKNLYTVNPLDRSIGGVSARRAAGALAGIGGAKFAVGADGKMTMTKDGEMNNMLAKDYVGGMQKNQARGRAIDIKAISNSKKTLTNVIGNAMTSGLNSGGSGGGGTNGNATSGPITVGGNTGAVPNIQGFSGAKGPVPGSRLPNNFNGFKLATPAGAPTTPETPEAAAIKDGVAAIEEYNKRKEIEAAQNTGTGSDLKVKNLTVENLNIGTATALPNRPGGSGKGDGFAATSPAGKATSLLAGIAAAPMKPVGALSYNPQVFKPKPVPVVENGYEQYKQDNEKLADIAGGAANALSPENLQKAFGKQETAAVLPSDIDHTNTVVDNLPGENGNFNFGGMGPQNHDEE